jgi:hypothetical protein
MFGEMATALATCLAVPLGGVPARAAVAAKLVMAMLIARGRHKRMSSL